MKKRMIIFGLVLLFCLALVADSVEIQLKEFCCPLGAQKVARALNVIKGVTEVSMDADKSIAYVTYDPGAVSTDDLVAAIRKTGYTVKNVKAAEKKSGCMVKGVGPVDDFHEVLHAMHESVEKGNLNALKGKLADMKTKRDALLKYGELAMDKASCKKSKDSAKELVSLTRSVSKGVDKLEKALTSGSTEKIKASFERVHTYFYEILEFLNPETKKEGCPGHKKA